MYEMLDDITFTVPRSGVKKYTAHLANGKKVSFGDRRYEHYRDQVPRELGGQRWRHLDHEDPKRRESYRRRHGAIRDKAGVPYINMPYSPAWFSYHFLW